ncbi:ABC transporter permease [Methyloraptor flagellatus]|uniref:ABC transporter permease n=1 Tax=Methyloraptor flagellatus TaxID=3162530 RepID=A0AAU7XG84_9HYPH
MPEAIRALKYSTEAWLALAILVLAVVWTIATPHFLTVPNLIDLVESYTVTAVLAMGLFVVLVSGGIDISFAATASVAQYIAALAAARWGWPPAAALGIGLAVGVLLGLINAVLIHGVKITSIIVTIATMSVYFALLMYFTGGKSIYDLPDWWSKRVTFYRTETAGGDIIRITLPLLVMVAAVVGTWALMNKTAVGRQVYAMGGNPEAARRVGIGIGRLHLFVYGFMGFMAAVAGLLQAHRVGESVPNAMVGSELNVVAAAVLGGASLTGGIGSVGGVILGILMLAIIQNGLNLIGVSPYFFQIVIGLVILVSTSATGLSNRPSRRSRRALA